MKGRQLKLLDGFLKFALNTAVENAGFGIRAHRCDQQELSNTVLLREYGQF
ncbi:hypothetical protein D3C81_2241420 [compost metagenome]